MTEQAREWRIEDPHPNTPLNSGYIWLLIPWPEGTREHELGWPPYRSAVPAWVADAIISDHKIAASSVGVMSIRMIDRLEAAEAEAAAVWDELAEIDGYDSLSKAVSNAIQRRDREAVQFDSLLIKAEAEVARLKEELEAVDSMRVDANMERDMEKAYRIEVEAEAARWKAIAGQLAECVFESGEYAEGSPRKFRKIAALAAYDAMTHGKHTMSEQAREWRKEREIGGSADLVTPIGTGWALPVELIDAIIRDHEIAIDPMLAFANASDVVALEREKAALRTALEVWKGHTLKLAYMADEMWANLMNAHNGSQPEMDEIMEDFPYVVIKSALALLAPPVAEGDVVSS